MNWRLYALPCLAFALACAFLLPYRLSQPDELIFLDDAGEYSGAAVHLAQDGEYSLDGETPFVNREPGYSVFLAGIYLVFGAENAAAVFAVQALLHLLASLLFVRALRPLVGRRASVITLSFLLLLPPVLHVIFSLLRESLTLSLFMLLSAGVLHLVRKPGYPLAAGVGAAMGAIILTYSPFLLFPGFLAAFLLLMRLRWPYALVLFLAAAVIVAPWPLRNGREFGQPCLTGCNRSVAAWYVRGEQAETVVGMEAFRCLYAEYISRDWSNVDANCSFNAVLHRRWPEGIAGSPDDEAAGAAGRAKILANFPNYLWFSVFEVLELHLPYVNGWGRSYNLLAVAGTVLLYLGCLLWLLAARAWRREYALPLLAMAYTTGVFVLTDATPRYLMPVIFAYVVFAGIGFAWLLGRFKRFRTDA